MNNLEINENGPLKDTVIVQGSAWIFVEVELTNPGLWAIHCHSGQHAAEGMMKIIQVGDEFPENPDNWPTCEDYSVSENWLDLVNQDKLKFDDGFSDTVGYFLGMDKDVLMMVIIATQFLLILVSSVLFLKIRTQKSNGLEKPRSSTKPLLFHE